MTAPALRPGDIVQGWCSLCHQRTDKRYEPEGKRKLVCLRCEEIERETKGESDGKTQI